MDKKRLEEIKADNKLAIAIYDKAASSDDSVLLRAETVYIKELIEAYEELKAEKEPYSCTGYALVKPPTGPYRDR